MVRAPQFNPDVRICYSRTYGPSLSAELPPTLINHRAVGAVEPAEKAPHRIPVALTASLSATR
jgi:hypothetical protein